MGYKKLIQERVAISMFDALVLLLNLIKNKELFEDADITHNVATRWIGNAKTAINVELLESLIALCNEAAENKKFKHPYNAKFDTWLTQMCQKHNWRFNRDYNWLEYKRRDKDYPEEFDKRETKGRQPRKKMKDEH